MTGPFLLALGLAAYNNLINLWRGFHGPLYVPLNLAAAAAVVAVGGRVLGLSAEEMALLPDPRLAALGAAAGLALGAPLVAAALTRRGARLAADRRVAGLTPRGLLFRVLVRVPVGTALLEEVAFRGVLLAAWLPAGRGAAVLASSLAFGAWHVTPALAALRTNRPGAGREQAVMVLAASLALIGVAGALLALLRLETGRVAAPFGLHAALNGAATVAAFVAHRRQGAG